jgi:hypothetical protein
VRCSTFGEPEGLQDRHHTAIEISVADTGCGMQSDKLEYIFREFEQVESSEQKPSGEAGVGMNSISVMSEHRLTPTALFSLLGLGLAVVARIVEQLGGQLRVESKADEGSRFSFLIPLALSIEGNARYDHRSDHSPRGSIRIRTRSPSQRSEIDSLVEVVTSNHMSMSGNSSPRSPRKLIEDKAAPPPPRRSSGPGSLEALGSQIPVRPIKFDSHELDIITPLKSLVAPATSHFGVDNAANPIKLRVLVVEV